MLKAFGTLNERFVAICVVKILDCLSHLHQNRIMHCDLKAANIFMTKTGHIKLFPFRAMLYLRNLRQVGNNVATVPNWMAPEGIELKSTSYASDIWSLGCTIVELLTGHPPYDDIPDNVSSVSVFSTSKSVSNCLVVMRRIVEDDMPPLPDGGSQHLADFLSQCFQKDPVKRPTAEMLCGHKWLKQIRVADKVGHAPQDHVHG
jgi:serine/threonine protein kinase